MSLRHIIAALGMAYLVGFAAAAPRDALASHSIPSPRWWWDHNDNFVVDSTDGEPGYKKSGTGWGPDAQGNDFGARFNEAIAVWKNNTDFDPKVVTTGVNDAWVDGRYIGGGPWPDGVFAQMERFAHNRGTFFDLYEQNLYVNTVDFLWWRQPGAPSASCSSWCFSARGLFVHELGHGVRLVDLSGANCPPGPTMCVSVSNPVDMDKYFSLATDDINGANAVY